jgi:chemotaxis protein histidine kinase CheA
MMKQLCILLQSVPLNLKAWIFLSLAMGLFCSVQAQEKLPNASSPPAKLSREDGKPVWKTTVMIKSEQKYWWIKAAEVSDPPGKRYCLEDKSKDKSISKIVLNEIFLFPPSLKGENGLFNVQVVPGDQFNNIKDFPVCTYNANLTFRHTKKKHYVNCTFKLELGAVQPVAAAKPEPVKPVAKVDAKAKAKAEEEARKKAEAESKAKAEAEAKAKAAEEARKKAEAEAKAKVGAKAKAEAEARAKAAEEAQKKAEADAKAKAKSSEEAQKKAETEAKAKAEAEAKAKAAEEARKKAEAEAKAKAEPEKPQVQEPAKPAAQPGDPKVFQPEDLQEPEKVEISEETQLAFNQAVKTTSPAPIKDTKKAASNFGLGMEAYKAGDFKKAADLFKAIKKPATKRRGVKERDEYVEANYYIGLALQKTGDLKGAVAAYRTVKEYERYFPVLSMNMGICYLELRQFAKSHKAFKEVIRDQSRIPPAQFDDVMQSTRYFWAVTWTRLARLRCILKHWRTSPLIA